MNISNYLQSSRQLARLCSENGWIDNGTLHYDILELEDGAVVASIEFEEIVMDGSGCIAARVPCYGQIRIYVDDEGEVQGSELL